MKYHTLFLLKISKDVAKFVICCSRDWHFKGYDECFHDELFQHLLCLLLQCLSSVALNPTFHQPLIDADIADMLMQLLLPSDEWYYTNHSTKYAKYVKYHAARILVYLGQLHRLCGRVDLFDTKGKFSLNFPKLCLKRQLKFAS